MSRTIFNELGESRVINPRSGFSQFVDLSNNQTISGIKRFLSNLITNSNVNFNTTANERRIVFQPNEPYGYGGDLLSIYTQPGPSDIRGWFFDANGNLYCIGTGLSITTITFLEDGSITAGDTSFTSIDNNNGDIINVFNLSCANLDASLTINTPIMEVENTLYTDNIQSYTLNGPITFLSNLITNNNINFNTTANVSRIIFNPNEPAGSGSQIVAIYTEDENDGQGWFFDSVGNLYYLSSGLAPVKIMLSGTTGDLTILNNFNGFGDIICHNVLISDTIQSYSSGDITINNNLSLGSNTINSGNITSTGTISCVDISSTNIIYANNVNMQSTGFLNVNNITSTSTTGSYQTKIALSNEFIDINNSSLDIVATYIGFASPIQTLSTASKYMYIKPLSTGDFEIRINNISNKVLVTNWSQLATATQLTSSWYSTANVLMGFIDPNPPAGSSPTMRIMGTPNQYIYYNTSNNFGNYNSTTSVTNWEITANGNFTTTGNITANNTLSLRNASAITNITLDATTTSGDRLKIYGIASGTRYLYYNTSNNIGVYNTSTATTVWSIDGTTGNIVTIGSYSVGSFSATSFLCNSISPLSGTTFTFGITSNCNWLKSAGVNRILMFPSSTSGDIMQICRTGNNAYGDGYWYHNNTGNFGYNTGGITVWELLNTGGMNLTNLVSSGYLRSNFLYAYTFSTYQNVINMNNLTTSTGISAISIISQYCNFIHPSITPTIYSKYMFILPDSGGNFTQYINNVAGRVLQSDWANLVLKTDYNFHSLGKYIFIEHQGTANICGLWSNRIGVGGTIHQNGNSWSAVCGMECSTNGAIGGGGFNSGSLYRQFLWLIENTTGSGKALGLACNRTPTLNSTINTATQNINYALLGFYATNRGGGAYSFTGEHSSMVCDEEYDDLMNYNTDDFIGMVVCSSGKIYNLPYDCDGNTYEKQVDNIKSVDCQPMTRLSKKYKDKSVLGVISHIEKVGKNRNDLNATSWTGCLSLDKDERRRIRVASIGEGGIWITNEYGNIENGDYITTSNIAGYSTKQDTDFLMNYTIAKATMDCVFDIEKPDDYKTKYLGDGIYASYIACTYHSG